MPNPIRKICLFIDEGFSLLALTSAVAPLKIANRILGYDAYDWQIISDHGGEVLSDSRVPVSTEPIGEFQNYQVGRGFLLALIIGSALGADANRRVMPCVRRTLVSGAEVAGIGFGALLLAEMGMLRGRRCAVHWEIAPAAVERYPEVAVSCAYHTTDGQIHTCAGEASSFDLFLGIVASDFGKVLADQVNDAALCGEPRGEAEQQPCARFRRLERMHSPLLPIITFIEENYANPISMADLGSVVSISRRQIERTFHKHLGETPMKYLLRIRMERAHSLLLHTGIPVIEVAIASGFTSQSHFSKTYRVFHGYTPGATRVRSPASPGRHSRADLQEDGKREAA